MLSDSSAQDPSPSTFCASASRNPEPPRGAELHTLTGSTPPGAEPSRGEAGITPAFAKLLGQYERFNALIEAASDTQERDALEEPFSKALFALYDAEPANWAELAALGRVLRERNGVGKDGTTRGTCSDIYVDFPRHAARLGAALPRVSGVSNACYGSDANLIVLGRALEEARQAEDVADDTAGADIEGAVARCSALARSILQIRARSAAGVAVKFRAYLGTRSIRPASEIAADALEDQLLASALGDFEALQTGTAHLPAVELDAPLMGAWQEHQRLIEGSLEGTLGDVGPQLQAVGNIIRDTPALSLHGIGIKASWALTITACGERDHAEVLRQVEAFAHRHDVRGAVDVPRLEREAMHGLPAADWPLYRLFLRWLESANEYRACEAEREWALERHGRRSDTFRSAHAATAAEAKANHALRLGLLAMPAASVQGVQLKAMIYRWLCGDVIAVGSNAGPETQDGSASPDAFDHGIARDLARLGCPAVLLGGASRESNSEQGQTAEERAA